MEDALGIMESSVDHGDTMETCKFEPETSGMVIQGPDN